MAPRFRQLAFTLRTAEAKPDCPAQSAHYAQQKSLLYAVTAWSTKVKRVSAKAEIDTILSGKRTEELSSGDANKIRELVTSASGWKEFKKYGQSKLLGDALVAFQSLGDQLRNLGIYLVQGGELESFHPEVSRDDKAAWLQRVLEEKKHETCEKSSSFIKDMVAAIVIAQ